jgi:hypothetical protein
VEVEGGGRWGTGGAKAVADAPASRGPRARLSCASRAHLSPVPMTMPRPLPAVTMVVKKQRLTASRGTVMSLPLLSRYSSG